MFFIKKFEYFFIEIFQKWILRPVIFLQDLIRLFAWATNYREKSVIGGTLRHEMERAKS